MQLKSSLSREVYMRELRRSFSSPWNIWEERVVGVTLGPFFALAHYQEYEWNRRITSECNRAWGYVKEADGELEVCFLRGKGLLAPGWMLLYTLFLRCVFLLTGATPDENGVAWAFSLIVAVFIGLGSAFTSSITEAGEEGYREVTRLLMAPEQYYG